MDREQRAQSNEEGYQVIEAVAILQRSIWRRARHVSTGERVLLHSLRSGVAEPRRHLELELERRTRLGTCSVQPSLHEIEGDLCIVVRDFSGAPLEIPEGGLELGRCLELGLGMVQLLNRLHALSLLHQDINPHSFLVDDTSGRVELADFLAISDDAAAGSNPELASSLAYVAPERIGRLNRRADHRADYYSFGVTLFQMLTGALPFSAPDAIGWAHAHVSKRAPLVTEFAPHLPAVVARLVSKLLAKDPDERYQSGHGLASDLTALVDGLRDGRDVNGLTLAAHDVSSRFLVSRELVGRESELATLSRAFEEARAGEKRLVLLSGPSGIGKSAVLGELLQRQSASPVRILATVCDEQAQAIPLAGLTLALRGLASDLLSLSEVELSELRQRVLASLGDNADILADLAPALSCITGSAGSIVPLNPIEAQRRLQHVFVSFVRIFATPERPLVLVLDDAQWLDDASAEVLAAVLTSPDTSYVLVLAALRSDDVPAASALQKMRQSLEQAKKPVLALPLGPLPLGPLAQILSRSLHASITEVRPLAEIVSRKTDGNPFFVDQLLVSLHRQGAVRLDAEQGRWEADLSRAEAHSPCDNVGVVMAERLERLSGPAAELLAVASCFGMRFDLPTLAEATNGSLAACAELLREAAMHRLVTDAPAERMDGRSEPPSSGGDATSYAFEHSRVQQAALSRLGEHAELALHLRIGRIWRKRLPEGAAPARIFALLQHLNAARAAIHDGEERADLAELNLLASRQALQTGAWTIAASHAEIASDLLAGREKLAPELTFRAIFARAETAFLLADARCDTFCEQAFALAPDRLARGRVHVLKTRILEHGGRMAEAVIQVRAALGELGVRLPESPDEINQGIGEGVGKLQAHLARVTIEGLPGLPKAEDSESRLVLELLAQVIPPAFQTYPPLFILAELIMFDLSLTRGVDAVSCKNFADCSIILMAILGDYEAAYRLGVAAFELLKRFSPTSVEAGVCFVFAGFLSHWKEPYREVFAIYDRAERTGSALGDLQHVAYAKNDRIQRSFLIGARLRACREQVAETRRYLTHISAAGQLVNTLVVERAAARLMASEAEKEAVAAADAEAIAVVARENSAQYCYAFGQAQLMTSFILGDFADAHRWLEYTRQFLMIAPGQFSLPDYQLVESLLAVRACREAAAEERPAHLSAVEKNLEQLATWSRLCPENFAHKYHLLSAEHARLTGQSLEVVLARYRDALRAAGDGFMHWRAVVHERQAELWLALDDALHARTCLESAYRLYADWGATAKLELLTREHPALLADTVGGENVAHGGQPLAVGFDSASLLKATQSIFAEVEPERLFTTLMATLIENAGAQHGCLVLRDESDEKYYVEARAHVDQPTRSDRLPYQDADYLCPSVVSYVLRTGDPVMLDDASKAAAFRSDPQIRQRGVRSVLCAPIVRQGAIMGALYVENNASAYAFARQRVTALQVLASQAAISIYNAQLYDSLERRVARRTEELALKNRQIASMLDNLDQGVFTIDQTLCIEPGYSRKLPEIFGTTELVGRECLALLLDGAVVRPDVLATNQAALRSAVGQEAWLAELNADHLIREVERVGPGGSPQFLELSWNFIASELDLVERLLVTVRDVTLLRQLGQTARKKEREVDIIVQVLDSGIEIMREFCDNCRQLLADNRALLASGVEVSEAQIAAAFRNLHTLKGDARLHGFTHLVDCLHVAEDAYDALRRNPTARVDKPALLERLDAVEALVGDYETVCLQKLAGVAKKSEEAGERVLQDIRALVAGASSPNVDFLSELRGILARLEPTSVARLVEETRVMLPSLGAELGKPAPAVVTQQVEVQLSSDWTKVVKDVLVQCFRNALYHGIEAPDVRERAGKPAQGSIHVRTRAGADGALELSIFDDGRGLWLAKLRERPGNQGLADEALAEQLFLPGVSTAESIGQVAGRGVGLDIVRASLQARGGDVLVRFTGDAQNGYRPFMLVMVMPKSALASRSGERPSLRSQASRSSAPMRA